MSDYARALCSIVGAACLLAAPAYGQSVRPVTLSAGAIEFLSETIDIAPDDWNTDNATAYLASVDLDGDGLKEHVVQVVSPATCSNGTVVCAWVVYAGPPGRRAVLSNAAHTFRVADERTNGWRNLIFESRSRSSLVSDIYAYDGATYRLRETKTLQSE